MLLLNFVLPVNLSTIVKPIVDRCCLPADQGDENCQFCRNIALAGKTSAPIREFFPIMPSEFHLLGPAMLLSLFVSSYDFRHANALARHADPRARAPLNLPQARADEVSAPKFSPPSQNALAGHRVRVLRAYKGSYYYTSAN
jgi:hypothetical protein